MKVTRIIFNVGKLGKSLANCGVVLDDSIMLSDISLHKGKDCYYLIFPSKQDVYKSVRDLNEGVSIKYPVNSREGKEDSKKFEEFFHPVSNEFYKSLLDTILIGYENCENQLNSGFKNISYIPN